MSRQALLTAALALLFCSVAYAGFSDGGDAPNTSFVVPVDQTVTNPDGSSIHLYGSLNADVLIPPPPPPTPPPPPPPPPIPPPPAVCTRTLAAPGNLQAFVNGGQPGETLCIEGAFTGNLTISGSGFTLRASPGQTASLGGGSGFTLVTVYGDSLTLQGIDVSGGGVRNCLLLGPGGESNPANVVNDLTLDHMRVHNCGNDNHEHAVYAEFTNRLHIVDSWLYASGGFGITFYPEANDTLVEYTVIDGNDTGTGYAANLQFAGEVGGGEYTQNHASDRNVISSSLITFASPGTNTQSLTTYWPGAADGVGNELRDSCVWSPSDTERAGDAPQIALVNPTRADPLYANRAAGDFTLQAGSPCLGKGPR